MREERLLIVDSVDAVLQDDAVATLVDKMLGRKLFLSIYPLKPWFGERMTLRGVIPDEVEVVGGKGIENLEKFCAARRNVYARLREWLPKGCLFAAGP